MVVNIKIKGNFPHQEISKVISSAIKRDRGIGEYKKRKYLKICKKFEEKYKMSSDEFLQKFDSGELDERDDFFDWYAAKKGLDIWQRKLQILGGAEI